MLLQWILFFSCVLCVRKWKNFQFGSDILLKSWNKAPCAMFLSDSVTKQFYRPTWWSDVHHLLHACHDVSCETSQTCPNLVLAPPAFLSISLCCCITLLNVIFHLFSTFCEYNPLFQYSHISYFTNAHCVHCLLLRGRKRQSLPPLTGKKGQAGSGADRTKPPPLWCVYRECVTAMWERQREASTLPHLTRLKRNHLY